MDRLNMMLIWIIVCGWITGTIAIKVRVKLIQHERRLDDLEVKSIETELKVDDILSTLNQSQCTAKRPDGDRHSDMDQIDTAGVKDTEKRPDGDIHSGHPVMDQVDTVDVKDAISRFQLGFKEEKLIRKQAMANMKQELERVGDELRNSVQTALMKVNDVITNDKDAKILSLTNQLDTLQRDINESLETSLEIITGKCTTNLQDMKTYADDNIVKVSQGLEAVTESTQHFENYLHEMKSLSSDNRATIASMAQTIEELKRDKLKRDMEAMYRCSSEGQPVQWNGHTYMFVKTKMTFDDAIAACQRCGAHLVDVLSDAENIFVFNLANGAVGGGYVLYQIGLNDRDNEGVWRWHHNNERASYFNWAPREPNGRRRENCVELYSNDPASTPEYMWNDNTCHTKFAFICKL